MCCRRESFSYIVRLREMIVEEVLSTLVFKEINTLLYTHSVQLPALQPLTGLHLREGYVGTTDASQERMIGV